MTPAQLPASATATSPNPVALQEERGYWILLSMVAGIGPVRFQRLLELCGSAQAGWHATETELAAAGLERRSIASLRQLRRAATPQTALARLDRFAVRAVTLLDADYPAALRNIADPPHVLFVRGRLVEGDARAIAVVGTRRSTAYGRAVAEQFARDLALAGVTVVSGLAKGVDTVAHRAALDAGGRTVAVLGNGLDQVYPPENQALAERIVREERGAVVSEFAPGVPPDAANFPRRNRIISGLSQATLIVEAGVKSGALITADFALEQGRDVFAVPGSILSPMSAGSNQLIRQGATPALEVADVLETIGFSQATGTTAATLPVDLPEPEAAVLRALRAEPRYLDEIARDVDQGAGEVAAALMLLELKGLARQVGAMAYVRG